MAYGYYQQSGQPSWGANQFQFGAPPTPTFQPQPTWGGTDYYRAHAMTSDPYLFDHAWNRVREYGGAPAGEMGVGLHEARHWHHRAYSRPNEVSLMAPNEIGHAAAYQAYRTWIHNSSIYEPLRGDIERQREALTGLAVGEATRLMQRSGRPMDQYARLAASEAAAHTASYIFYQSRDDDYRSRSRPRYRRESYDDLYAYDDELAFPRSRSQSRHRHRSRSRHSAYGQPAMVQFPGQGYSTSMSAAPHTSYPGQPGSYGSYMPSHGTPYHHTDVPMSAGSGYGSPMSMGMGVSPSAYSASMPVGVASSYHGSSLGVPISHSRSRSNSMTYPPPYLGSAVSAGSMGQPMSASGIPMVQPTTIVIHKGKKHKRHRSSHRRSRSSDPGYDYRSSAGY